MKATKMTKTTDLARFDDAALCRLTDDLGNRVWTCRRRGWTRKLDAALTDLGAALAELTRRIEREQAAQA